MKAIADRPLTAAQAAELHRRGQEAIKPLMRAKAHALSYMLPVHLLHADGSMATIYTPEQQEHIDAWDEIIASVYTAATR